MVGGREAERYRTMLFERVLVSNHWFDPRLTIAGDKAAKEEPEASTWACFDYSPDRHITALFDHPNGQPIDHPDDQTVDQPQWVAGPGGVVWALVPESVAVAARWARRSAAGRAFFHRLRHSAAASGPGPLLPDGLQVSVPPPQTPQPLPPLSSSLSLARARSLALARSFSLLVAPSLILP